MLSTSVAIAISGLLTFAGVAKLRDPGAFREALVGYGLPNRVVVSGALTLPVLELALGIGTAIAPPVFLVPAGVLLLAFATVMTWAIVSGRAGQPCGCFGARGLPLGWSHVVVVGGLSAIALLVSLRPEAALVLSVPVLLGSALSYVAVAAVVSTLSTVLRGAD